MPQQEEPEFTPADPWQITGYLVAGVVVYGVLGWLVDRWLGTRFLVAVGMLLGTGFAMYLIWRRLNPAGPGAKTDD